MKYLKHLTGIYNLSVGQITDILDETSVQKKLLLSNESIENLKGKSVLNLFFENSTRTRLSFERAENLSGLNITNFNPENSSLAKGESIIDTIRNIDALKFDFIISRHPTPGFTNLLLNFTKSQIINAGDGTNEHPTQALLDMFTLREHFGNLKNKKVCIVGDISHSRVALSDIFALSKLKANISVCGPNVFIPRNISSLGVSVCNDINFAIKNNDALILLRVQLEREAGNSISSLNEYRKFFGINSERLKLNENIAILHPGPFNKNVELDEDILDLDNLFIFEQVTNGLAVKLALFKLMSGS
ncbi:aspartate carbamoyltransferase catalytic subunit [Ignavibacteria bacterium CHB1]|nr:MAG: aspartate carbamoyltransferase catalytic subunit [Chlorobiota bacterium]MBV6398707.1 Aspartate carbamoyltransferase [Ignavibacteria bacterium]MCC6885123.1 aspartate carbamoyltransferase catalytic subunit [Ignavibacteriales bacterium]MCE7952087.1 aspartate carbamoyltransferase catalytic subunit [Chlorobi bacterium CHB7]MDL1886356.1 aspartate carbamoyltransferase catalytic subunit [Ignavibacteria bacterium CHB1]RIK48804.1 MAG: aspartate carbamoyltransferase [Ignavibacteriota bacterium]